VHRFLRRSGIFLLWAFGLLLLLAIASSAWFLHAVGARLQSPGPGAPVASLLHYREPPPRAARPPALQWRVDVADPARLASPGPETRPWARWWWPGGDVDAGVACQQLQAISAQGFGGVEIQAFNAGLHVVEDADTRARINRFDSPAYYATLRRVLDCARRIGMKVYLNHLSGWPAGGPQVPVEEGLQELRYTQFAIPGGRHVALPVPAPSPGLNDYFLALAEFFFGQDLKNFVPEQRSLVALVAARPAGGARATNPFDATDTWQLQAGTVQDLTARVREGTLEWDAPEGEWTGIAVFVQPSGEAPTLIAAERPGFVIDHMNAPVLQGHYDYAFGSRTGLPPYYGAPLEGIFNDSLEFKVDRLGAVDILEAFRARRGYDLVPYLPAVFADARDNYFIREVGGARAAPAFALDAQDRRIAHDYQRTISDLVIERFVDASSRWASERGLLSRGQSYGSDIDTLKALGHNDIPETEQLFAGGSAMFLKLAGSAAFLYDRPMVSAEAFVWHNLAYAVEPARLKAAADTLLLGGVNQIIYHGIPYEPQGEAYTAAFGPLGWYPFLGPQNDAAFSDNYGPSNPAWDALPDINRYLARCQNLLRAGRQEVDVLLYYPFLGFPLELERSARAQQQFLFAGAFPDEPPVPQDPALSLPFTTFPDDGGDARRLWLESIMPVVENLDRQGITWGWVNDDALATRAASIPADTTVLVANAPWIEVQAARALDERAARGGALALLGTLPRQQPGFRDVVAGDREVRARIDGLASNHRVDIVSLAAQARSALRLHESHTVRRVSRRLPDGAGVHFFSNSSREQARARIELSSVPGQAYWFDPRTGHAEPAALDTQRGLPLALAALESRFLVTLPEGAPALPDDGRRLVTDRAGRTQSLTHWALNDVTMPRGASAAGSAPADAGSMAQPPLAARRLQYSATLELPDFPANARYCLDIDRVDGTLQVSVNGTDFGTFGVPPYRVDVTHALQRGDNRVRLTVTPPLRNSLLAAFAAGDPHAVALAPLRDARGPAGQVGAVTLTMQTSPAAEPAPAAAGSSHSPGS